MANDTKLPDADLREVPGQQRHAKPPALGTFLETADPHEAMVAAYRMGAYSMQAVADACGLHYSTVTRDCAEKRDRTTTWRSRDPELAEPARLWLEGGPRTVGSERPSHGVKLAGVALGRAPGNQRTVARLHGRSWLCRVRVLVRGRLAVSRGVCD